MVTAPLSITVEKDALRVISFEQVMIILQVPDATMREDDCQQNHQLDIICHQKMTLIGNSE